MCGVFYSGFVYDLLHLLPFTLHKWVGSWAPENRDFLYQYAIAQQAPSSTGTFSVRLLAIWVTPELLLHAPNLVANIWLSCMQHCYCLACWVQEWMQYSLEHVLKMGIPWYCNLGCLLSATHCMRATDT